MILRFYVKRLLKRGAAMRKSRKNARGQALVLFLGFAAAMIGMMLVAFNSGQVTNAKMRAMNAADAAAYSGAVWQARTLNFQAYMNRAIIVNEVAIAQSVSLRSWIDYVARFVSNIDSFGKFIPYIGPAIHAVSTGLDRVDRFAQRNLSQVESIFRVLNHVAHDAQKRFHFAGVPIAEDLARAVAKKNGAEVSAGSAALFLLNVSEWAKLTASYTRSNRPNTARNYDGRKRLKEVALNSRDGFTRARDWDESFVAGKIRKQGGTDLIDYDSWKALDSAGLCIWSLKGCKPVVPLGWGGAQAYSSRRPVIRIGKHGDTNDWNETDGRLAKVAAYKINANSLRQPSDFPSYRDVQDLGEKENQMLPFAVEVVVKGSIIPSANTAFNAKAALTDGTALEYDPHYQGTDGGVYALAEACVMFERPHDAPRAGGGKELPSLFNPYWRASLATVGKKAHFAVDTAKKLPSINGLVGGNGSCH